MCYFSAVALGVPNISPKPHRAERRRQHKFEHALPTYQHILHGSIVMNQLPNGVNAISISPTESRLVVRNFQANVQGGEYRCVVSLADSTRSRVVFISPRGVCNNVSIEYMI